MKNVKLMISSRYHVVSCTCTSQTEMKLNQISQDLNSKFYFLQKSVVNTELNQRKIAVIGVGTGEGGGGGQGVLPPHL